MPSLTPFSAIKPDLLENENYLNSESYPPNVKMGYIFCVLLEKYPRRPSFDL
jgi:hypothetical protein